MPRTDPAEQSRSRRERILDAAFSTFATRGYRDTAVDDIAGAAETSKGGIYFHFPTKEAIFRELMQTTADKLVGARWSGRWRSRPSRSRAPRRRSTRCSPTFAGHRTMARLLFLDTVGAGRVFQAETNALHERFARLIQGYLDEAVAAGAMPADGHADHEHRLVRGDQRGGRRAGCWPSKPGRLEDAYPALRAALLRSAGVPGGADRRGPAPAEGWDFPEAAPMTAVRPPGPGGAAPAAGGRGGAAWASDWPGCSDAGAGDADAGLRDRAGSVDRPDLARSPRPSRRTSRPRSGSARRRGRRFVGIGRAWATEPDGPGRASATPRRPGASAWPRARIDRGGGGAPGRPGPARRARASPAAARRGRPVGPVRASSLVLPGAAPGRDARRRERSPARWPAPVGARGRPRALERRWERARRRAPAPWRPAPTAWSRMPVFAPLAHRRRAARPRPLAPAGRHVLRRRRPRPHRQGGPRAPRRACGPRWSSTSPTPCGASPPAPPRARSTPSGAAAGPSWAPRPSASSAPRAAPSGPSPSPARSAAAPMPPRTSSWRRALLASEKDREEHAIVVLVHPGAAARRWPTR